MEITGRVNVCSTSDELMSGTAQYRILLLTL